MATVHAANRTFTPFVDLNPSVLSDNTFATVGNTHVSQIDHGHYGTAYGSLATPGNETCANPWTTAHAANRTFAPFVGSNPLVSTESTFAAGPAYDNGIALPTARNPYTWVPTVAEGHVDEYLGANFQYPDPSLSMMSPMTGANGNGYQGQFPTSGFDAMDASSAGANSNGYQGQFPANSFNNRWAEFPNGFLAVDGNATRFDTVQEAPPPPTCATCSRAFGRQADLDRHAKKHQADSNVFRCSVAGCGYSNYRKDKLRDHIKRRHQVAAASSTQL